MSGDFDESSPTQGEMNMDLDAIRVREESDMCLVWNNESSVWWRPNRRGYTINILDAGIYSRAEAESIVKIRVRNNGDPADKLVFLADALGTTKAGTVHEHFGILRARLAAAEADTKRLDWLIEVVGATGTVTLNVSPVVGSKNPINLSVSDEGGDPRRLVDKAMRLTGHALAAPLEGASEKIEK